VSTSTSGSNSWRGAAGRALPHRSCRRKTAYDSARKTDLIQEFVLQLEEAVAYKTWVCVICGWVYDEEQGWPEDGIAPGTRWEDVPDEWRCPECDVGKAEFAMIEL